MELSPEQVVALVQGLPWQHIQTLRHSEQINQKLTYELALLKRHAFDKRSEQLNVLQINWTAPTRYLDDGELPIDNNRVENLIRPWVLGRSNWLFAGSLRSGQRAVNIMSLIHELLPQHWKPVD